MYVKLGRTDITYKTETKEDYMIVGEVIDSPISYEKPILVRSKEELDIWFSQKFPGRSYLVELLDLGTTLYLYKPISTISTDTDLGEYVNYDSFETVKFSFTYVNEVVIKNLLEPVKNLSNFAVKVYNETISNFEYYQWIDSKFQLLNAKVLNIINDTVDLNTSDLVSLSKLKLSDKVKIKSGGDYWIYLNNEFILVSELPQNLGNSSVSLNNRDTLRIYDSNESLDHTSPIYSILDELDTEVDYLSNISWKGDYSEKFQYKLDLARVDDNLQTLAFNIQVDSEDVDTYSGFVVITKPGTTTANAYYCGNLDSGLVQANSVNKFCDEFIQVSSSELSPKDFAEKLKAVYRNLGYEIINRSNFNFEVVSNYIVPVNHFYEFPNLYILPNQWHTYSILSKHDSVKNLPHIDFFSKTIGGTRKDDINGNIKVSIEKSTNDEFRIIISRYDYTEVFEGPLVTTLGKERLDFKISRESKLVYCRISGALTKPKIGEWTMRGGYISDDADYITGWNKSLDVMFSADDIYPDFFLIPNMNDYNNDIVNGLSFYPQYANFLKYSKKTNTQFLIQNSDSIFQYRFFYDQSLDEEILSQLSLQDENINTVCGFAEKDGDKEIYHYYYRGNELDMTNTKDRRRIYLAMVGTDAIFNYIGDKDNRLVYFFRPMLVNREYRPGYYLFLNSILLNKTALSSDNIIYKEPNTVSYKNNVLTKLLSNLKSNYLVNNNLYYYYEQYQNGKNPLTTIWMRFALGKVDRELKKNKWNYLGEKTLGEIQRKIEFILSRIVEKFDLVKNIDLTSFSARMETNSLNLKISTSVNDYVNNDITLDITIDYQSNN